MDTELSHSVHKGGSVDTQADCSTISTTDAALACGKRLYDFQPQANCDPEKRLLSLAVQKTERTEITKQT